MYVFIYLFFVPFSLLLFCYIIVRHKTGTFIHEKKPLFILFKCAFLRPSCSTTLYSQLSLCRHLTLNLQTGTEALVKVN